MSNPYFTPTGSPGNNAYGSSATMRAEFVAIQGAFDLLPTLSGNGSKIIAVNSGGTALEAITTTGTGNGVRATSPTLVTPTLGVATATSINKVTLTAPASGSTLTIADGKTLTANATLTLTGTDGSSVAFGAGGTVLYSSGALGTPSSGTLTNCTGLPTSGLTGTISNGQLANSSVTVNGTSISLGGSGTVTAAAGTLTGGTLAAGVTASSLTSVGTLTSLTVSGATTLAELSATTGAFSSTMGVTGAATFGAGVTLSDGAVAYTNAGHTGKASHLISGGSTTALGLRGETAIQLAIGSTKYAELSSSTFAITPAVTTGSTLAVNTTTAGETFNVNGSVGLRRSDVQKWHYTVDSSDNLVFTRSGVADRLQINSSGGVNVTGNAAITGTLSATSTVSTGVYTVATLPSAATAGVGARAFCTDLSNTSFNALAAGGAAGYAPVWSNGANWYVG